MKGNRLFGSLVVGSLLLVVAVALLSARLAGGIALAQGPAPAGGARTQATVGNAFTYQGRLTNGSGPVNGTCDLKFTLFDAASGGSTVGSTLTKSGVTVTDGTFTTPLDFGAGAFGGEARWLRVQVRCPAGSGSYTTLSPRQALTPAPYALALPALRTEQNTTSPNVIGGYRDNNVSASVVGATIGGGGASGDTNLVTDDYGTVGGGQHNQAGDNAGTTYGAFAATVGGGNRNTASGDHATIGGGFNNASSGETTTIAGGYDNIASGDRATISGGFENVVSTTYATVGGGTGNHANGYAAFIGGGFGNTANDYAATIAGGSSNVITTTAEYATIGGGYSNSASGPRATVGGGRTNTASDDAATVGGGDTNTAGGMYATVGGGYTNTASGPRATVGGGRANTASGDAATVGGGKANTASATYATVPGGGGAYASGYGQMAYASGYFAHRGDAQASLYVMRGTTGNSAYQDLYLNGSSEYLTVRANSTVTYDILVAGRSDAGESAGYYCWGVVENMGGTTTVLGGGGSCITLGEDDTAWDAQIMADDTNDSLDVQVLGNGETIRWVATVRTAEVSW